MISDLTKLREREKKKLSLSFSLSLSLSLSLYELCCLLPFAAQYLPHSIYHTTLPHNIYYTTLRVRQRHSAVFVSCGNGRRAKLHSVYVQNTTPYLPLHFYHTVSNITIVVVVVVVIVVIVVVVVVVVVIVVVVVVVVE